MEYTVDKKHDIETPEDIRTLINSFYHKVRQDDVLGYIFNEVAQVNWEHHLPRMYAFWEFLLIGGDEYRGNPLEPHQRLHQKLPLKKELFDRWLEIFSDTVDDLFAGKNAEEAKNRASLIAMTWLPKFADNRLA